MSVIKIDNFGGLLPSVSPRALPANASQVCHNLFLGTSEFRPMKGSLVSGESAVANAKTIFRFGPAHEWKSTADEHSFVRGQINGDTTQRNFFTQDDVVGPPRVINNEGANRQLGVPAPTVKPAVTHVVVDELRVDELAVAESTSAALIEQAIVASIQSATAGNGISFTAPSPSTFGWSLHETDPLSRYIDTPLTTDPATGNVGFPVGMGFLASPALGGFQVTEGGQLYWRVKVRTHASTFTVDQAGLQSSLLLIDDPYRTGEKLLDASSASFIATETSNYFSSGDAEIASLMSAAVSKTALVESVLRQAKANQPGIFLAQSESYSSGLRQLVGDGSTGDRGSVVQRIMDSVYLLVSNSFFFSQKNEAGSFINDAATTGTPLQWWMPSYSGYTFTAEEGESRIRTAIFNKISQGSDGLPQLDYAGLKSVVLSEFNHLVSRRPSTESQTYYAALVGSWADEALAPLQAFFERSNLELLALGLTGTDTWSAFAGAVADAENALNALTAHYAMRRSLTNKIATNAYRSGSVIARSQHADVAVEAIEDTRFYVYTYVTDWDEESAPSPVSDMVTIDQNDYTSVVMAAPPSGRYVVKWRLYRTNVGSTGADYQFVDEGPVAELIYEDKKAGESLGEIIPTTTWLEPPSDLRGLVGLPNGIMAGFYGNTIAFCEPYVPYAWPVSYQITLEYDVVGMAVFGQTLFVGTTGNPYFASGSDSASMSAQKLETRQACVSRKSIAPMEGGVLYASPDGLCLASGSGVQVVTSGVYTRDDWQALTPAQMFASQHEGIYYCMKQGDTQCLMFDLASKKIGTLDLSASSFFHESETDTLYACTGTQIVAIGRGAQLAGRWKTKKLTLPAQSGFGWLAVLGEQAEDAPALIRLYGDGALIRQSELTDISPVRLPHGRWIDVEVEVECSKRITSVTLAGETLELQQV